MAALSVRQYLRLGCRIKSNGSLDFSTSCYSMIKWRLEFWRDSKCLKSFKNLYQEMSNKEFIVNFHVHFNIEEKEGIEPNPNRFGPLTNLPDYSFVDGRPTPISSNKFRRLKLQEEYCRKIVELSSEIDFAVERHRKMKEDKELEKKQLLESKLKPKGELLQKQKS